MSQACPEWVAGDFGECSKPCDTGKRTRSFKCKSGDEVVLDSNCSEPKPVEEEDCNTQACPKWVAGEFGLCSEPCDTGKRTRSFKCKSGDEVVLGKKLVEEKIQFKCKSGNKII